MADLGEDTEVQGSSGSYVARVSKEWELWGPCGGYVAAIALRAAGAESRFTRPVSLSCHYLGMAAFDEVELSVTTLRTGRTTESLRVSMSQGGKPIVEAMVLAVSSEHGLDPTHLTHDVATMPAVPRPADLPTAKERLAEIGIFEQRFPFWASVESHPVFWFGGWPPPRPLPPVWQEWEKFLPNATSADPWIDAARSVVWIDLCGWPAASRPHAYSEPPWVAVNVDLYVAFHRARPESEYLLVDAESHIATEGLIGYTARTWSEDGALVASGGGQLLSRPVGVVPNT